MAVTWNDDKRGGKSKTRGSVFCCSCHPSGDFPAVLWGFLFSAFGFGIHDTNQAHGGFMFHYRIICAAEERWERCHRSEHVRALGISASRRLFCQETRGFFAIASD